MSVSEFSSSGGQSRQRSEQVDELLVALAADYRRQVVRYFRTTGEDVASVDDLVDHAIAGGDVDLSRGQLKQHFHHVTLPKLADYGVIEYDVRSQAVRYCGHPVLERLLTVLDDAELQ